MTDLVNFIRFEEDGNLAGNIASMAYDLDIFGEAYQSTNPKAPVYRLFAKSPRGRRVEIGGIWEKENQNGGKYFSLSVSTGYGKTPTSAASTAKRPSSCVCSSRGRGDWRKLAVVKLDYCLSGP
ncbi:DUF736 family protein [Ensifer sp. SL37]|uniref:DUF736 family protein n=1 Tax=Ensifer sp. SL37 TaxID=2995137 RepID=UPI002275FF73|nr:DUF736 family protein [Ensifer sp. SL37]MCY1740941.1 DUF736 family protein [Ensifer sp. SL37]